MQYRYGVLSAIGAGVVFALAYMYNGYFTALKTVVDYNNTRDVLPRCKSSHGAIGVTCWPAPEQAANLNTDETGNLGLTTSEEDAIVPCLKTLTDGYGAPAH